jgi:hypothetical protein
VAARNWIHYRSSHRNHHGKDCDQNQYYEYACGYEPEVVDVLGDEQSIHGIGLVPGCQEKRDGFEKPPRPFSFGGGPFASAWTNAKRYLGVALGVHWRVLLRESAVLTASSETAIRMAGQAMASMPSTFNIFPDSDNAPAMGDSATAYQSEAFSIEEATDLPDG